MTDHQGCSKNMREVEPEDNDIEEVEVNQCNKEAYENLKENFVNGVLQDSRKRPPKQRSNNIRSFPTPTKIKRQEQSRRRAERNEKRYQDDVTFYLSRLVSDQKIYAEKSRVLNVLLGTRLEEAVKNTLRMADVILKNILGEGRTDEATIRKCFQYYEKMKVMIDNAEYPTRHNPFQKECDDLNERAEKMERNKELYSNYKPAKARVDRLIYRATLKVTFFNLRNHLDVCERKIGCLNIWDDDLKATVWSLFLSPIDEYYQTSVAYDKFGTDYTNWRRIRQFYGICSDVSPEILNENGEEPSDDGEEVEESLEDMPVLTAIQDMDSDPEFSEDWAEPDAGNEATASTSLQPSTSTQVEDFTALDGAREALRALFSQLVFISPTDLLGDPRLRDAIKVPRRRRKSFP